MIKNVIFDLGNVIFEFKPKEYFEEKLNDKDLAEKLCDLILNHDEWNEYDLGNVTLNDLKQSYAAVYPDYQEEINYALDNWMNILKPIDQMIDTLKNLQANNYQIFILSNVSDDAYTFIKDNYRFINETNGAVLSYEEHLGKPDKRIYEVLINRYNLNPNESIYLDDLKANVLMGKEVGFNTIQVDDPNYAIKELEELINVK